MSEIVPAEAVQPEPHAAVIRRRRVERGLSQGDLAGLAGVSRGSVRNAEAGKTLEPNTRNRIEEALNRFDAATVANATAGPALIYVALDGATHEIDAERWDPSRLTARERAVCKALLNHAHERISRVDLAEKRALAFPKEADR